MRRKSLVFQVGGAHNSSRWDRNGYPGQDSTWEERGMAKSALACLLLLLVASAVASAALIFSVTDANQTVLPGSDAIFHGVLTNTGSDPMNIVSFVFLNAPADSPSPPFPLTEPAIPFTLQAGGQFSGIVADIAVPIGALPITHNFAVAAFSDQHDTNGNSISSNSVNGSLTVAPEPASVILVWVALLAICIYQPRHYVSKHR
jgi:hypothetical protein